MILPARRPLIVIDTAYNVHLYIDTKDRVYRRKGQCKQCGKCCVALRVDNLNPKTGMCMYLNRASTCTLQLKGIKPIHCRLSPRTPHDQTEGCGFVWEEVK